MTHDDPLPVQMLAPWVDDNAHFQNEMDDREDRLADILKLRGKLDIALAKPAERCLLDAVDAAQLLVECGDQVSILVQSARVCDDGATEFGSPQRVTGINGHEFVLAAMPMRIVSECCLLANSTTPTIADLSYWSFLMDMNQIIMRAQNTEVDAIKGAMKLLIGDGIFLKLIENPNIIPMTKTSQSDTLLKGVSDRHVLTMILKPDEYVLPRLLVNSTVGSFAMARAEKQGFDDGELTLLREYYQKRLGVVFYKPHEWSRAFRIEGHIDDLRNESWLMALLAAIKHHTIDRMIQEPWPQFMVDYTVRRISGLAPLYGKQNWHRHPDANYVEARTNARRS
jgi:hypothetical protein